MPRLKRVLQDAQPSLYFECRNKRQEEAQQIFQDYDLIFMTGLAGSGKTHLSLYLAIKEMMAHNTKQYKRVDKIYITRPIVEAGEHLGALPGEVKEKVHPYMLPIYDCIKKIVNAGDKFIEENIVISPLAYLRGVTFEHCVCILDEAQNCTITQLKLFMTRLGIGAKMIIAGDTDQSDIQRSGLLPWVRSLKGKPGIGFVEFTEEDIVRHPLVRTILRNVPSSYVK